MMGFLMSAIMTYLVPMKYGMAMGGVYTIIKKHPKLQDPEPGAGLNLFLRLPHKGYFML